MKGTKLEQFTLEKVKTKGQGLEVNFEVEETAGAEVYHDKKGVKSDKTPHPDLKKYLDVLRGYVAQIFYFSVLNEIRESKVFMATKKQSQFLTEKYNSLVTKITITGVSLSGKEDNRGIIITAKLKTDTGQEVAINSQRLKYNGTKYGFEENLEQLMSDLEQEVYEYIINGKKAQLEMAFDEVDGKSAAAGEKDDNDQLDLMEQALEETTEEKSE